MNISGISPLRLLLYGSPLLGLIVMSLFLLKGLSLDSQSIPSVLINQKVPTFQLAPIQGRSYGLSSEDLQGQVSLVNIFGSWCLACLQEHGLLMRIKAQGEVPIFGINWREVNGTDGPNWLKKQGNPYTLIGNDPNSEGAIAFGVTGAPETFIIDPQGIIRYRYTGPITDEDWETIFVPIIRELRGNL